MYLQVGYDSRDGYNYFQLNSTELVTGTNAGSPGRWVIAANRYPGIECKARRRMKCPTNGGMCCISAITGLGAIITAVFATVCLSHLRFVIFRQLSLARF